jgi:peptidoglycan hydrolase-like protein with peptidoglycan-binding domain
MRRGVSLTLLAVAIVLAASSPASATSSPASGQRSAEVAALQTALWNRGIYRGDVSGLMTPRTLNAVKRLQRAAGLVPDGIVGPLTRPLFGRLRGPALGVRTLRRGLVGADVAELQFLLSEHGFPCAHFDGRMGEHTVAALRRFQTFAGLSVSGRAGPLTLGELAKAPPQAPAGVLDWPVVAEISSLFGPRGRGFHPGIDLAVGSGTPVKAAAAGEVVFTGAGAGYGLLVEVAHSGELHSFYAHLSRIDVFVGQQIEAGAQVGLSGATGKVTGPHLHFELRLRGAAVDPLPALS